MQTCRPGVLAVLALSVLGSSMTTPSSFLRAQASSPISHICPMDPGVVEDQPGSCPVCKMTLQPVRIETAMACPVHPQLRIYDKPGTCPVDKRELIPVVVNHFWDCGEKPERFYTEPGKCPDGRLREEKRLVRAHGDHNPRHGGQFFMAEDKWHHLEATYQRGGPLRIYLYDNFTKDLAPRDLRAIAGLAVVLDGNLASIESVPLTPSRDGQTLEARLTKAVLPLRVQARVKFKEATREQPFDFTFQSFTSASTTPVPPVTPVGSARRVSPPVQPPPAQASAPTPQSGTALPNTSAELLGQLELRRGEVKSFIDEGNLGMVYVPAMLAKDVSLALADHGGELRGDQVVPLTLAVKRLVVAAWRLDQYGDLGDREKLTSVYADFAASVADIEAAYAAR